MTIVFRFLIIILQGLCLGHLYSIATLNRSSGRNVFSFVRTFCTEFL